jgi:glycerol uptake facilitator protein
MKETKVGYRYLHAHPESIAPGFEMLSNNITRGDPASNTTFSIFATFPAPYYNGGMIGPLIDQIVGTMFLIIIVFALTDTINQAPRANLALLLVGFAVAAIGMSYRANAGYAINPARNFGPWIWALISGWGQVAFPGTVKGSFTAYFWVPIVGPFVGGVIGAYVYDCFIQDVLTSRGEQPEEDVEPRGETDIDKGEATSRLGDGRPSSRRRPRSLAREGAPSLSETKHGSDESE